MRAIKAGAQGYLLKSALHRDCSIRPERSTLEKKRSPLKPATKLPSMLQTMPRHRRKSECCS